MQDAPKTQSNPNDSLSYPIGKIKDAHGIKGELFIRLFAGEADWLDDFEEAYLISPDRQEMQSIQIEKASRHKDGLIVRVADVTDRTPAEGFKGWSVEIPSELLIAPEGEDFYLGEVVGFEMHDLASGIKAKITGISSNTFQDLILVNVKKTEYMVPFVTNLIDKIDFENRVVRMNLPSGLLGEVAIEPVGNDQDADAYEASVDEEVSTDGGDDKV